MTQMHGCPFITGTEAKLPERLTETALLICVDERQRNGDTVKANQCISVDDVGVRRPAVRDIGNAVKAVIKR